MKKHEFSLQIVALLTVMLLTVSCDRSNDDAVQPVQAKIAKQVKLYSNFTLEGGKNNTKNFSEEVGNVIPGQAVKVLEIHGWDKYKVQLPDGTMGWLEAEYLEPNKNTFIKFTAPSPNRHLASNRGAIGNARKIVKEVNKQTAVTRLEEYREVRGNDNVINWTKVRTNDGIEGWIMSSYLFRVVMDPVRYINRKEWNYGMDYFKKKWIGKPIEEFEKNFKDASGIKVAQGDITYYFNNIFLLKGNKKFYSVRVHTGDGTIKDIDTGIRKTNWAGYLPLSSLLRINLLVNYLGNWNYILENETDLNKESFDFRDHLPGWLTWVVYILIFLIMLAILYGILRIPYFLVNKWTLKRSLNRELFNKRVMLYAVLATIVIGYIYYVLMVANFYPFKEYFFITTFFCLGMILENIHQWRNDLDYNRCNSAGCHQWTGQDNGTEFLGGETVTQTIRHSNGGTERNRQTTRRYRDHRKCSACGYEWSILRTEVIGGLKV